MLIAYANDATLLSRIPCRNTIFDVNDPLKETPPRSMHGVLYGGKKPHFNKTQSITVSRSRTLFPLDLNLLGGNTFLKSCESFEFFSAIFHSKFTSEKPICSISSPTAQKIDLLRKSSKILGECRL